MTFVNLTPHAISIDVPAGRLTVPPSGDLARVAIETVYLLEVCDIPTFYGRPGPVEGLPAPAPGRVYIVSLMVVDALAGSGRADVFAPATGPSDGCIRNEKGHVVAVTKLRGVAP